MKGIFQKPTVFFVIGLILIIIGLPLGIYGLTLSGGASLGGALILIAVFIVFIFFFLDRILIRLIGRKKLNIYEALFLIIASVIYLYQNRQIQINQLNQNSEFMIVVENNGALTNDRFDYKFPFGKKISTNRNFVVAKKLPSNIDLKTPRSWDNSYSYDIYHYQKYPKVILYRKISIKMDSLKVLQFIETNIK